MIYQEGYVYHIKNEYFEFDGKKTAFLLQNMFPVTEYYLDHIHTRNNNPVPVKYSIHRAVSTNMKQLRQLHARGRKVVFPDISRLERLMLAELKTKGENE